MKRILIIGMCILLIATTASAAALDSVSFDIEAKTITVSGNIGQSPNGRTVTLMVLNSGEYPNTQTNNIEYSDIILSDKDGNISQTFEFSGDTADYVFIAVDETGVEDRTIKSYYNQETLDTFAEDAATGKLTDAAIIADLKKYADAFTINMTYFSIPRNEAVLLSTIKECKNEIISTKAQGFASAIRLAENECLSLDKIQNAPNWYEVEELVASNYTDIGVNYDNFKNHPQKAKIFSALIGNSFAGFDKLGERLNELYKEYESGGTTGGGGSSSGGGGGGGGGAYSPSITMGHTATTPEIEQKPSIQANRYSDVDSTHWAWDAIENLSKSGVLSGKQEGIFDPDGMVTRGEIAKMLTIALGYGTENVQGCSFADVNEQMWQYPYVSALTSLGIVQGVSDTMYGVDTTVSRQDLAVLLHRVLLSKGLVLNKSNSDFTDFESISTYARDAVTAIAGEKIINGMPDGSFSPMSGATRAQAAKLIYEILQKIK